MERIGLDTVISLDGTSIDVSTIEVCSGIFNYETCLFGDSLHHSAVVEVYETEQQAIAGHRKWVLDAPSYSLEAIEED